MSDDCYEPTPAQEAFLSEWSGEISAWSVDQYRSHQLGVAFYDGRFALVTQGGRVTWERS